MLEFRDQPSPFFMSINHLKLK